ncbi:MAG TPA: NUDIX hydrolase [Thermoanaerobaculia bacterium]|nr:NUDIX hydrolase [Thermoanaerobaculia bacterium]
MDRKRELLDQLRSYVPADVTESRHRESLVALVAGQGEPFSRGEFEPGHVTASCFIIDGRGSHLLLHHHKRLGRWLQMGGHVDDGETVLQAALREGAEESGLPDLTLLATRFIDLDVHPIPAGRGEPPHRHFDVRYVARTLEPESMHIDPEESSDLAWVDLRRAAEMMNEAGSARVLRKIERLYA